VSCSASTEWSHDATAGRFDIVGWDIRGSAGSSPVLCFADASERASFWQGLGESHGTLIGQTYANLFPRRVRAMALDGVVDPVAATTSTEAVLASGSADTDRVFRTFLRLCEAAGPDRCALAGHGPVAVPVSQLLTRLRHNPIPVPSGELTYGEALTALKYSGLPDPALWPEVAAVTSWTSPRQRPGPCAPLTVSRSIPSSANHALDGVFIAATGCRPPVFILLARWSRKSPGQGDACLVTWL
jgi:pimeloyl-ACP methyl ester carboxylesterase